MAGAVAMLSAVVVSLSSSKTKSQPNNDPILCRVCGVNSAVGECNQCGLAVCSEYCLDNNDCAWHNSICSEANQNDYVAVNLSESEASKITLLNPDRFTDRNMFNRFERILKNEGLEFKLYGIKASDIGFIKRMAILKKTSSSSSSSSELPFEKYTNPIDIFRVQNPGKMPHVALIMVSFGDDVSPDTTYKVALEYIKKRERAITFSLQNKTKLAKEKLIVKK